MKTRTTQVTLSAIAVVSALMGLFGTAARAQFTITYAVDQGSALTALGAERLPDMICLDLLGWTLDPATVDLRISADLKPSLNSPANGAMLRTGTVAFVWSDTQTNSDLYWINIFHGSSIETSTDVDPFSIEEVPGFSYTLTASQSLRPGVYTALLVGTRSENGTIAYSADPRTFTVLCPTDFDGNGLVQPTDLFAFLNAFFAGCLVTNPPTCVYTADFNADGVLTPTDIFTFLNTFFLPCP